MDNLTLLRYVDGEMTGPEKQHLEHQLSLDSKLREELDSLLSTRGALKLYGWKQKITGIHGQMMEELGPKVISIQGRPAKKRLRMAIAVAASLILLIGAYFIFQTASPSAEKVFASNYSTYELITLRDNDPETPVEKAYRAKNYNEVLRIHDAGEDHSPTGEFLCGASALEVKNFPKAIKCFNEVLDASRQTGLPLLKDEAEYYLSLAYIRNHNYTEALGLMESIQKDPAHKYNEKINDKLIRQVDKLNKK